MRARRHAQGFTLLEILIVVALIAAFVTIVGARIGGGFGIAIGGEGRVVAAELRHASQRALATGRTQRWVLDLDAQAFRLEEEIEVQEIADDVKQALRELLQPPASRRHFVPVSNRYGGWRWLDEESVHFDGVETRAGFIDHGSVAIGFGPDGGADLALVYLSDEHANRLGVRIDGFTAAVRILDEERLDEETSFAAAAEEEDPFAVALEEGEDETYDAEEVFEEPDDAP